MAYPNVQGRRAMFPGFGRNLLKSLLATFSRHVKNGVSLLTEDDYVPTDDYTPESGSLRTTIDDQVGHVIVHDPIVEILQGYPVDSWTFRFSESRVRSQWAIRATGSCTNPKGATVTFEIFAPPVEAIHESGLVKVTVDTICVYHQSWDGYRLGPNRSVREEVLRSPFWKWIQPRYEGNLRVVECARRNELAVETARTRVLIDEAILKL